MATYGSFPGVKVKTEQGGIQSVSVGLEEKIILFGEAAYTTSDEVDGDASAGELIGINAPSEAEQYFGDSEIADAMNEAISNGGNIDFLRAVAVPRKEVTSENQQSASEKLDNVEIEENIANITVDDVDGTGSEIRSDLSVEFRYDGAPSQPTDADTVYINPLTGDYAVDSGPSDHFEFTYNHMDYESAFQEDAVSAYVNENETGFLFALSDSDTVSTQLNTIVSDMRKNYQLVTGFCFAEPNGEKLLDDAFTTDTNGGADPRYDTANYDTANQSVSNNAFFKPAPARVGGEDEKTIGGGLAGLYAGNPIDDAVYNEVVSGYSSLTQTINKTEAEDLRKQDLIPVRNSGSVRVKGNRATNFSQSGTTAADFWTRRITDRVILVVKQIGDAILGLINNPATRSDASDAITRQLGSLAQQGIIKPNGESNNFGVQVYESSTNKNEVKIDVQFTPYGIVKQVDATVTVNV